MNEVELKKLAREIANSPNIEQVALKILTDLDFKIRSDKLKVSLSEGVTKENISELAKMTAKQIYTQGYVAGELVTQTETWNAAIEKAALIVQPDPHIDEERRCEDIAAAIRSLKKTI